VQKLEKMGWSVEKIADEDLPDEIWKQHANGAFFSNLGRYSPDKLNKRFPRTDAGGYACVEVKHGYFRVHTCVLEAFGFSKPSEGHTVDHVNRCRFDNRLCNLRWATRSEQNCNQIRSPCESKPFRGRKVGDEEWMSYTRTRDAANATGCDANCITNVLNPKARTKTAPGFDGARFEFELEKDPSDDDLDGELWTKIVAFDWLPDGKYHCTVGNVRV